MEKRCWYNFVRVRISYDLTVLHTRHETRDWRSRYELSLVYDKRGAQQAKRMRLIWSRHLIFLYSIKIPSFFGRVGEILLSY